MLSAPLPVAGCFRGVVPSPRPAALGAEFRKATPPHRSAFGIGGPLLAAVPAAVASRSLHGGRSRLQALAAGGSVDEGGPTEIQRRGLEVALKRKTAPELLQLCERVGVEQVGLKKMTKAVMVRRLTAAGLHDSLMKLVMAERGNLPVMSAEVQSRVKEALGHAERASVPIGAGAGSATRSDFEGRSIPQALHTGREQEIVEPVHLMDVGTPLRDASGHARKPLASFKIGQDVTGHIVGVSLLDGVRLDVGAEVDAIVPLSDTAKLLPLGKQVTARIEDIVDHAARRFPLVCSLPEATGLKKTAGAASGQALRLDADAAAASQLRLQGELEELLASHKSSAGTDDWRPLEKEGVPCLHGLPTRPAPHEVLSIDSDGSLRIVEVPKEHQAATGEEPAVADAAARAWQGYALDEVEALSYQLRCRENLARDLCIIETDLAANKAPSVPVELLGFTLLADGHRPGDNGRRCMLPVLDGDVLTFRLEEFKAQKALEDWLSTCRTQHEEMWWATQPLSSDRETLDRYAELEEKRFQSSRALARFYACTDVCHARAVAAVEKELLRQKNFGTKELDVPMEDNLEEMISAATELASQEEMMHAYLDSCK